MTSTIGVTLISLIGAPSAAARVGRKRAARLQTCSHGSRPQRALSICRDRMAENSSAKPSSRAGLPRHVGIEFIIENDCGDGREQAERGGEQGLGDAGRYHGKARVLGNGDRLEARS